MKKFLLQILGYIVLIFVLGSALASVSGYFLSKSYFYKPNFIANHFNDKSHFNYILAGSSRGLTTINTVEVDEKLGLSGLNISMDDTGLPSQFLMIQHFFESGLSADYCILTLDLGHFYESEKKLNDNDYRFISYSNRSYVKKYYNTYEKGIIQPLSLSTYFPLLAFSYYNMELIWPSGLAAIKPSFKNRFDHNGNYFYPNAENTVDSSLVKFTEIEKSIKNPILEQVDQYLKNKNCHLIIYIAPYYNTSIAINDAGTYEVINHSGTLKLSKYFFDIEHVNELGRASATNLFIEDLKILFDKFEFGSITNLMEISEN